MSIALVQELQEFFAVSLSRDKLIFNDIYDVAKASYKVLRGEYSLGTVLPIVKDKLVKCSGGLAGAAGGISAGMALVPYITAVSWWNPLGWIFVGTTTYLGCISGSYIGRKVSEYFDISNIQNSFNVLGIEYTCDKSIIKKRYIELCLRYHPDKGGKAEDFHKVNNAYSVICAHLAIKNKNTLEKIFLEMLSGITFVCSTTLSKVRVAMACGSGVLALIKK